MNIIQHLEAAIRKTGVVASGRLRCYPITPDLFRSRNVDSTAPRKEGYTDKLQSIDTIKHSKQFSTNEYEIREYLSSMKATHFARQRIRKDYDIQKAKEFTIKLDGIKKSTAADQKLFSLTNKEVGELIGALISVTPANVLTLSHLSRKFPAEDFKEIPLVPKFDNDPLLLEQYIGLLTHTRFHFKSSSKTSGIIPKLLRNLMHPSNINTIKLKNTTMFNDVIYYYSKKWDFASCRELYSQMKIENKLPDTRTYNLLLLNLVKNCNIIKRQLPFKEAIFYLIEMKKFKVHADPITWATCYHLLMESTSRAIFIEKMVEKNIPFTPEFLAGVLKSKDCDAQSVLEFIKKSSVPINIDLFTVCTEKLVLEKKYEAAWQFIVYMKNNGTFGLNSRLFNIFIKAFANKGRIDLALLTFNSMRRDFKVVPSIDTFHLMFKALAKNGYHENFCVVHEWLRLEMLKHTEGLLIPSYWITKCRAICKYNIEKNATPDKMNIAIPLLNFPMWSIQGLKLKCWREYRHYRKTFRLLGSLPITLKPFVANRGASQQTVLKKSKYKRRLKLIALHRSFSKKEPYLMNHFAGLKGELQSRKIINA